jgi:hypothetical protein
MTTDDHNKTLGILHLVYAALQSLLLVIAFSMSGGVLYVLTHAPGRDAPPFVFFLIVLGIGLLFSLLFLIPPILAGVGLLKRKSWGRTAGIVAAILMALNIPFGTALSVYSFWFLLGKGAQLYEDESKRFARYALGDAPPQPVSDWVDNDRRGERERVYAPSAQPPDWRS